MHLLGLEVADVNGGVLGQVVDTYPFDGGGELEMIVLRLRRFGERRMLPVSELRLDERPAASRRSRGIQIEDSPGAQQRPPRRRGSVALEDLLVLRGLRGRSLALVATRGYVAGRDGAPALAAPAR